MFSAFSRAAATSFGILDASGLAAAAHHYLGLDHDGLADARGDLPRLRQGCRPHQPSLTGTPYLASSSFAWYSWSFTLSLR